MATRNNRRFAATQRRLKITELYLKGRSQAEIASELNVSQSTVSEDLQHVRRKWEDSAVRNFDELRSRELQKLEYVEREGWAAWDRSQKPAQSATVTGEGNGQHTKKSMKQQIGDPRFLDLVCKCISQRRAITGLDVVPLPVTSEGLIDANLTVEVRQQQLHSLIHAYLGGERLDAPVDEVQPGTVRDGDQPGPLENGPAPGLPESGVNDGD